MALCFFLVLVEAASFLLVGARLAVVGLVAVLVVGTLAAIGDELDWAAADDKEPSENRNKVPAKNATAKLRTQTLPTAESWRP